MVRGSKPNQEYRQRIAELRRRGLSLSEIGRQLGVSRQSVHQTLRRIAQAPAATVRVTCVACGCEILSTNSIREYGGKVHCLPCLQQRPDLPFGPRLQAHRLAAGLTRSDLGRLSGIDSSHIAYLENRCLKPRLRTLARLVQVLGPGLLVAMAREERQQVPSLPRRAQR
jgi:transcriptional regulator with XRE-family HTH domain